MQAEPYRTLNNQIRHPLVGSFNNNVGRDSFHHFTNNTVMGQRVAQLCDTGM